MHIPERQELAQSAPQERRERGHANLSSNHQKSTGNYLECLAVSSSKQAAPDHTDGEFGTAGKQRLQKGVFKEEQEHGEEDVHLHQLWHKLCKSPGTSRGETLAQATYTTDIKHFISRSWLQSLRAFPSLLPPRKGSKGALPGCHFTASDPVPDIAAASASLKYSGSQHLSRPLKAPDP